MKNRHPLYPLHHLKLLYCLQIERPNNPAMFQDQVIVEMTGKCEANKDTIIQFEKDDPLNEPNVIQEDLVHSCSKCNIPVSEIDFSKISRKMPPQNFQHILTECLGVSSNDIYKAEYKHRNDLQGTILETLIGWKNEQNAMVTKAQLYRKFTKAIESGICECSEWFDFLIPSSCRDSFPICCPSVNNNKVFQTCTVLKNIVCCLINVFLYVIRGLYKLLNWMNPKLFPKLASYALAIFCFLAICCCPWEPIPLLVCAVTSIILSPILYLIICVYKN